MASAGDEKLRFLNFNVGVLGHVDSGKTALAKALSTTASTASFDKNPQSKERGITLDLGFSSFAVPLPKHLSGEPFDQLQFTLVDCPGHASLIKTIIGGAQIIDLMMLVVDITKGMQTQTAECLVIGEIACNKMVVVVNKIDLIPPEKRQSAIDKMSKKLLKTLEPTRLAGAKVVAVAAKPGGPEAPETGALGISELISTLCDEVQVPQRRSLGATLFSVDHCFSIRGQGTVMTGTLLSGAFAVNDTIEIPSLKETRKIKSMQMFRRPVKQAKQGDRVGICVTQFDPKLLERGLVCSPGALPTVFGAIVRVHKIPYFKSSCATKAKYHVTMGHETVMARLSFFSPPATDGATLAADGAAVAATNGAFDFTREYVYQDELLLPARSTSSSGQASGEAASATAADQSALGTLREHPQPSPSEQWLLVEFERPVICPHHCLVIGSRLDADIHSNTCRLAFHGKLVEPFTDKAYRTTVLPKLKVFKMKYKEGAVDRMADEYTVIGRSLFKKETNIQLFAGLKVHLSTGEVGVLEGSFGQSGKFKVRINGGLKPETVQQLSASQKKKGKGKDPGTATTEAGEHHVIRITLSFKRYVYDLAKRMVQ